MGRIFLTLVLSLLLFFGTAGSSKADPAERLNSDACLKEFGFYSGWGRADIGDGNDYDTVYIGLRFGLNLEKALNWDIPGILLFMVEPFVNPVTEPDSNYEAGCGLLLKYAFPFGEKFYPYIEGGSGGIYISEKTPRQGSHGNFADQAGVGFYYFMRDDLALNVGYRFRHISNLSIEKPNRGIDSHFALAGISLFY